MKRISCDIKTAPLTTLVVAGVALMLMWPQWRKELQAQGYCMALCAPDQNPTCGQECIVEGPPSTTCQLAGFQCRNPFNTCSTVCGAQISCSESCNRDEDGVGTTCGAEQQVCMAATPSNTCSTVCGAQTSCSESCNRDEDGVGTTCGAAQQVCMAETPPTATPPETSGSGGNPPSVAGGGTPPPSQEADDVARSVLTQHNDSMRTGAYLVETQLRPNLVCSAGAPCFDPATTGPGMEKLYEREVDGKIFAQLLYARRVQTVKNGERNQRNVVFAFTNKNTVYAYDADDEGSDDARARVWDKPVKLLPLSDLSDPNPYALGIWGTPVIDIRRGVLYVPYGYSNREPNWASREADPDYRQKFYLAKLDIGDGNVLKRIPVNCSYPSCIVPSNVDPHHVDFDPTNQWQRAGLLLAPNPVELGRSTVYVAFGARAPEEGLNYHGWVMGYDADDLEQRRGVFCSTPDHRKNGEGGGIWQGGAGLAADGAGNVYFNTGNGPGSGMNISSVDPGDANRLNHGNSVVKLTPVWRSGAYDFDVAAFSAARDDMDHIVAWEKVTEQPDGTVVGHDIDLGGGGVTVIPGSNQLVGGGKTGVLYLMDRTTIVLPNGPTMNMLDKIAAFDNLYVQEQPQCPIGSIDGPNDCSRYCCNNKGPHLHGAPTYWQVSPGKGYIFHWSEKDHLKQFEHNRLSSSPVLTITNVGDVQAEGLDPGGNWIMPGGMISLSANGTSDGILWITLPWMGGGRIFAYDANPQGMKLTKLWDRAEPSDVFSGVNPPTVADGRVFAGTKNKEPGKFVVYGLAKGTPVVTLPAQTLPAPTFDPNAGIQEQLNRLTASASAAIAPPSGHRPFALAWASGSLTYEAQAIQNRNSVEWILVGLTGDLQDKSGVNPEIMLDGVNSVLATADHGLTWVAPDGTQVTWSILSSVNAPKAGNAPWMLFQSVPSAAPGTVAPGAPISAAGDSNGSVLNAVSYVQQIGTEGGAPPRHRARRAGEWVDVPFTALYALYVSETNGNDASHPN